MAKQCPHCGSYNTRSVVAGQIGNLAVITGRGVLALGAFAITGVICPHNAHIAAHKAFEGSDPGKIYEHYCRNCRKYFE